MPRPDRAMLAAMAAVRRQCHGGVWPLSDIHNPGHHCIMRVGRRRCEIEASARYHAKRNSVHAGHQGPADHRNRQLQLACLVVYKQSLLYER